MSGNRIGVGGVLYDMDPVTTEYFFGTGDGELSRWSSVADFDVDGDGVPDAVRLDFDGDGLIDDLMWDSDGDGVADRALLDLDDDGHAESVFADSGRGLWDLPRAAPEVPRRLEVDVDGDGVPDTVLIDTDGDGVADEGYVIGRP